MIQYFYNRNSMRKPLKQNRNIQNINKKNRNFGH